MIKLKKKNSFAPVSCVDYCYIIMNIEIFILKRYKRARLLMSSILTMNDHMIYL